MTPKVRTLMFNFHKFTYFMLTSENWEAVKILVFTISVFAIGLVVLLEYKQAIFDQFLKILCIKST